MSKHDKFLAYCMSFYGSGEMYDLHVKPELIEHCARYVSKHPEFDGDTVDRERVRALVEYHAKEFFASTSPQSGE